MAAQADAIVTFNLADFAVDHLESICNSKSFTRDDFVMDLVELNEKRAVAAFRELRSAR